MGCDSITWGCGVSARGARAVALYRQALARACRTESRPDTVETLEFLSWALAADAQVGGAARLLALAGREREEMGVVLPPVDRPHHERAAETAQDALGEAGFAAAWAEGEALALVEMPDTSPPEVGKSKE